MSATHTHVVTETANPYLRCDECAKPTEGFVAHEGQVPECRHSGQNVPCGHLGSTSVCPSWGPVDGCECLEHLGHVPHEVVHLDAEACLSVDETVALLRAHARTLIHSRLGGIGADWDLDKAIALAERATWRGWMDSLLGHNLGIEVVDQDSWGTGPKVRLYAFDVPAPRLSADDWLDLVADTVRCLADGGWVVKRKDAPWDEAVIEWAQSRAGVEVDA